MGGSKRPPSPRTKTTPTTKVEEVKPEKDEDKSTN